MDTYMKRIKKLKKVLNEKKIEWFIEFDQINIFYLTGLKDSHAVFLCGQDKVLMLVPEMWYEAALTVCPCDAITIIRVNSSIKETLKECIKKHAIKNIGMSFQNIIVPWYVFLKEKVNLFETSDIVREIRMIKDEKEIDCLRKACGMTSNLVKCLPNIAETKNTEQDIVRELHIKMLQKGTEPAFDTIIAFGKNTAYPHHVPSHTVRQKNDIMLADFGCKFEGYCADLTRVFFLDNINVSAGILKEIYELLADIKDEVISSLKPGVRAADIDAQIRNRLKARDFEKYFVHNTGHGVGLEVHELPHISKNSTHVICEGMVFTIEPGVYIPHVGGIRLEDTVLITKTGSEILTI